METGHKNNNFISFVPKPNNSQELEPKEQNLYASKKTQPPKTYTFYHSTRNQSNSRLSFNELPKKQYRYASEQSEEPRRKTLSGSSSSMFNYSGQQTKGRSPEVTHFHTENAFKKSIHIPQVSCFKSDLSASQNYAHERSSIRQALGKSQSIQQQRRTISTQMIESTIIMKQSQIEEQNRNFNITSETLEKKVQTHLAKKYSNIEEEFNALREKFEIIEAENKVLEKRNLDLVQQMLSSESIIRDFQQKQQKYEESTKKSEDSIKISRNIITSLNEKIARIQKENQINLKNMQESSQKKLIALENTKNEALKISEAQVFELKLKLIDQNHQLEEKVEKEKRLLEEEETSKRLREQLVQRDQKIISLQQELAKMNDYLARLDSDLLRLDQENVRLDQENSRLVTINSSLLQYKPTIESLTTENESLQQELLKLSEANIQQSGIIDDLKAQRQALGDQVSKLKEQVQLKMEEIRALQSEILIQKKQKQLRDTEIEGLNLQLQKCQSAASEKTEENDEITGLQQQLATIKDIAHELQQKLESSFRDRQILSSQIAILKQEISDNRTFVNSLQKRYEEKKEQIDTLQETIQSKDTQISQLNINLLNLQLEILDLKERIRKNESSSQVRPQSEGSAEEQPDLFEQYQKQIKELQSTIAELKEKECSTEQTILQLQSKIQDKVKSQPDNNHQVQSQLQQLQQQLQKRDEEIKNFKESLLSKENEIIELNLKIDSLIDDKPEEIPQTEVAQELESISEVKQKLQLQIIQNELLQSELNITKQQNEELSKETKFLETLKYLEDTKQSRAILDLKQQLQQSLEREQQIHRELEELKDLLKKQQQEYLITLDQEIKKITMIEQQDDLNHQENVKKQNQQEEASLLEDLPQQKKQEENRDSYGNNQMFEAWLQNIAQYSRQELVSKIQELIFVNKSLNMKVSELNEMQQNSNDIIMNKIRLFQEIIEKYQLQINELQEQNQVLRNQLKDLTDRCHFLEGKIEWMDTIYKEVQENLLQTNEELLKVQVQYINLKMSQETRDIDQKEPSEFNQDLHEEKAESYQCQSKNVESSMSEDQAPQAIEKKQNIIQELKEINLALQEEIEKVRSSQTSQKEESPETKKMEQEQWRLQDERRQDIQLRRFMEGEYYIKQSEVRGVTYSIVVSQIDSEDEEYEESPEKEGIEDDIDRMIEEYNEVSSPQAQIPLLEPAQEDQQQESDDLAEKYEKIQERDELAGHIVQHIELGQNDKNTEVQQKEVQQEIVQEDVSKQEKAD